MYHTRTSNVTTATTTTTAATALAARLNVTASDRSLQVQAQPDAVRAEYTAVAKRISECVQAHDIEPLWSMVCAYSQVYGGENVPSAVTQSAQCSSESRTHFYAAEMHKRVLLCTMLADVASRRDSVDVVVRRTIPESGTALSQLLRSLQAQ